jgi:hypothetical protein
MGVHSQLAASDVASAPLGLPASEQLAPVVSLNLDIEPLGRGLDAPPCLVAIGVTDPFDLVEASDGVAHVGSVGERLLARLGKANSRAARSFCSAVLRPWVRRGTRLPLARALWAARALVRFRRAACFCFSVAMAVLLNDRYS